jgi:hypothetical protein
MSGVALTCVLALVGRLVYDFLQIVEHYRIVSTDLLREKLPPLPWNPFSSTFHVVTVLKADEDHAYFVEEMVDDLTKAIDKAGGKVAYTGRTVKTVVQSKQFEECEYDILLNTHWANSEAFKRFLPKMKAEGWDMARSQV